MALAPRVSVSVLLPDPGAAMLDGLKRAVTPLGIPEIDRLTAGFNPPATLVVNDTVGFPPAPADTVLGVTENVSPGTFNVRVAVCVIPPPAAVIVSE